MSNAIQLSNIVLPPEIPDDFVVQDITSQLVSQNGWQTTTDGIGRYVHPADVSTLQHVHQLNLLFLHTHI